MNEQLLNVFYIAGYAVAWSGLLWQTIHIYSYKKARDFTLVYLNGLILAKIFALPRTITSGYWVWWLQEGISTALTVAFVIGIMLYRKR